MVAPSPSRMRHLPASEKIAECAQHRAYDSQSHNAVAMALLTAAIIVVIAIAGRIS